MKGGKIAFTRGVFRSTKQPLQKWILDQLESSPAARSEIAKVFQRANRRIQNIENAGLISPAVAALQKGDVESYTKFSMRGDWNTLKMEYTKAISFLRQPTSTATGVRQYNRHLMQSYDLKPDEFDLMAKNLQKKLQSIDDTNFVERYLMRYKDFTGELETEARSLSDQIESEAQSLANVLDNQLEQAADDHWNVVELMEQDVKKIMDDFDKFSM